MILVVQLRLTKPFLGELRADHTGTRKFKRDRQGRVHINQKFWQEQLDRAARDLQMNVKIQEVVFPPEGLVPACVRYIKRTWNQVNVDFFEGFSAGTVLTFDMRIHEENPKCPSLEQLWCIMDYVGENLGLSQWGSKFGLGRFKVVSIKAADIKALLSQKLQTISREYAQTVPTLSDSSGDGQDSGEALKTA